MKKFNVIVYNINGKNFESYDIIPYLVSRYNKTKKKKPVTFEEFKEFVKDESRYQWWARCEYEIILSPWPYITSPSERYDKKGEPVDVKVYLSKSNEKEINHINQIFAFLLI